MHLKPKNIFCCTETERLTIAVEFFYLLFGASLRPVHNHLGIEAIV